jgi:hypothetical protein
MSFVLASLVLAASVGVTINVHLCGGQVQSMALFVKAEPCHNMPMACHGSSQKIKMKGCCEEQSRVVKGKETSAEVQGIAQVHPSFQLLAVILPFVHTFIYATASPAVKPFAHYKPPLPDRDIAVLLHTFLI